MPRREIVGARHDIGIHPGATGRLIPDPPASAARPREPRTTGAAVEIDGHVEPAATYHPRCGEIVPDARPPRAPGYHDQLRNVRVVADDGRCRWFNEIGHVRRRIALAQASQKWCGEHNVANQSE